MFKNDSLKCIPYIDKVKQYIEKLSHSIDNISNTIYYGTDQCEILSLIRLQLRELFNDSIYTLQNTVVNVKLANHVKKKVTYSYSPYHFEIDMKKHTIPDFYMVSNVIYSLVSSNSINQPIKLIIIKNAEVMSKISQFALRRMMEIYSSTSRFMIECNQLNSMEDAIISRCFLFRIPNPSKSNIISYLKYLNKKTPKKSRLTETIIKKIVKNSNKSVRKAVFNMTLYKETGKLVKINSKNSLIYSLYKLSIIIPEYKNIMTIREIIHKLIDIGIEPRHILKNIVGNLKDSELPLNIKLKIIKKLTDIDIRIRGGASSQIHLEYGFNDILFYVINNMSTITKKSITI